MADKKDKKKLKSCTDKCKFDGDLKATKAGTSIRCLFCIRWFHASCVDVDEADTAFVWTCPRCREMFFSIDISRQEMFRISNTQDIILQ